MAPSCPVRSNPGATRMGVARAREPLWETDGRVTDLRYGGTTTRHGSTN